MFAHYIQTLPVLVNKIIFFQQNILILDFVCTGTQVLNKALATDFVMLNTE